MWIYGILLIFLAIKNYQNKSKQTRENNACTWTIEIPRGKIIIPKIAFKRRVSNLISTGSEHSCYNANN